MTLSTRLAVVTLMAGFLIEGVGEAFEFVSRQWLLSHLPHALLDIYYIGPATTVLGFLFAFAGRHEWSELHHRHVLHGHKVLLIAILALGGVAGTFAVLAFEYPGAVVPTFLPWVIGAATAFGLSASFLSYLLIGLHLTSQRGKVLLGGSVVWGAVVSVFVGYVVATNFGQILSDVKTNPSSVASTVSSLTFATTILFVSYFLLALGYHDAYRLLIRGILPEGHAPAKHYKLPHGAPSSEKEAAKATPPASP